MKRKTNYFSSNDNWILPKRIKGMKFYSKEECKILRNLAERIIKRFNNEQSPRMD